MMRMSKPFLWHPKDSFISLKLPKLLVNSRKLYSFLGICVVSSWLSAEKSDLKGILVPFNEGYLEYLFKFEPLNFWD